MALIKGMTRKEYMRQYHLEHGPKPTKYKIPCEHGLFTSQCRICKSNKRKDYYEAHKQEELAKHKKAYAVEHPPMYSICVVCSETFRQRTSLQVTCGKARCKKDRRNYTDRALRASVRSHYGTFCAVCSSNCRLEIDHKYGYGKDHRKEIGLNPMNSSAFYRWLRDNDYPADYTVNGVTYKDGFRVLCNKCNNRQSRKGRTNFTYGQ